MTQPRILHITRNLPPLVGGMERLNWHIADELSRYAQVQLIGPSGSAAQRPAAVPVTEVPLRPLPRFLLASAWQAVAVARRFQPHIVLAGSGLTAPAAWLAARASGARAHVYLHGLDAAVQHPAYRTVWHPAIRRMDGVIANSQPTAELARNLGVAAEKIRIVHPGVTLPTAPQSPAALQDFRQRHQLGNKRLLLSVGRLTTRKGLRICAASLARYCSGSTRYPAGRRGRCPSRLAARQRANPRQHPSNGRCSRHWATFALSGCDHRPARTGLRLRKCHFAHLSRAPSARRPRRFWHGGH